MHQAETNPEYLGLLLPAEFRPHVAGTRQAPILGHVAFRAKGRGTFLLHPAAAEPGTWTVSQRASGRPVTGSEAPSAREAVARARHHVARQPAAADGRPPSEGKIACAGWADLA